MKPEDFITITALVVVIILTCFIVEGSNRENESILASIRAEVKAEIQRQYKNIPHISVEKVYTLHANGDDILFDVDKSTSEDTETIDDEVVSR
jgi:hypothetical protein